MTFHSPPVDPATDLASVQLEMFPSAPTAQPREHRGLSRAAALASVGPGLWRQVTSLYAAYGDDVTVHTCEERDGKLVIAATLVDDDGSFAPFLDRIRDAATRTCSCCGDASARPYRFALDGPTRTVCDSCRNRLKEGATPLQIADDFFRLDGSRRHMPVDHGVSPRAATSNVTLRSCGTLPADELRRVIAEIRASMNAEVCGQFEAVSRLSLLAAMHVGGGLSRGGRALILGPSGVGKTSLIRALGRALQPWSLPWVATDALDLTSPGWSGAPSIGDLVEVAVKGKQHSELAVIVLDEVHHIGALPEASGSFSAKRAEVLASLLGIADFGTVHFENGAVWSSERALVIAMGAFTDKLDLSKPINIRDLVVKGNLPLELCTRFAEEIITLKRLSEPDLIELLRRWPTLTGLQDVCERLGYSVKILDESYRRAARVVTIGNDASTPRTAGGWLVSALRQELMRALSDPGAREIVIAPDSLPIPPTAMRRPPPDEPPSGPGDWDTTLILTRR